MKRFILISTISIAGFLAQGLSSALAQGGPGHTLMHQHYNVVLKHDNGNKHIAHGHCEVHHAGGGGHYFPTSEKGEGRLLGHPGAALSCIHGGNMFWGHIPKKGPHNNIVMKAIPLDIWGSISSGAKHAYHKTKKAGKKAGHAIKKAGKKGSHAVDVESDKERRHNGIACDNPKTRKKCADLSMGVGWFDMKATNACETDEDCRVYPFYLGHPSGKGCKARVCK
jgi:hypothetical protein